VPEDWLQELRARKRTSEIIDIATARAEAERAESGMRR
jgi:hypothetical protein